MTDLSFEFLKLSNKVLNNEKLYDAEYERLIELIDIPDEPVILKEMVKYFIDRLVK